MQLMSTWRLPTLLYMWTALIIVPTAGLLFYNAYRQYEQAEEAAAKQAYNLARITADNSEAFLRDAQRLLKTLSIRIRDRTANTSACDPIFYEFKDLYPQFANLSQANNSGYLICSTTQQPGETATYVGNMLWFTTVQRERRFIVAQPYVGVVTKRLVAVLAQPIIDQNNNMQGSIQLPIDLVNFRLIPGMENLPKYIVISLVNSDGILVARSSDANQFVGKNLWTAEAVSHVLQNKNGTAKSVSSQGVQRIFGYVPVVGTDWYAVAGIATDEVLGEARRNAQHNVIFGGVLLLLVAMLAVLLSRRISQPILAISTTARSVAHGEYSARARVTGPAEVVQVAIQFNSMLEAIELNIEERSEREAEIHRLAFFD